jgi:RNA polymerase sigma-70 factor (ECF subfamily)
MAQAVTQIRPVALAVQPLEETGIEALVRRHQAMVYSLALHSLRVRAAAEDVAQEVFLELHRNLDRIESPEHIRFWLRQVASRKCIDAIRRNRYRNHVPLDSIAEPEHGDRPADPLAARAIQREIACLPAHHRMVVIMRYQEDLDPMEIASLLDMKPSRVRSMLHAAVVRLRSRLEKKGVVA